MRLCSTSIHHATVVARMTYAASAWHGFTQASDRQRINSVIDRARRLGYCSPDTPTFDELCDTADDELFSKAVRLSNHVLHALLPPSSIASQCYNLRHRAHSLQLPEHSTQLSDSNFLTCSLRTHIRLSSQVLFSRPAFFLTNCTAMLPSVL